MAQAMERRVRSIAQELYERRGQGDGQDLQDWFQAEMEVLGNKLLAPLYRRMLAAAQPLEDTTLNLDDADAATCG